jgi:hypothetical protein
MLAPLLLGLGLPPRPCLQRTAADPAVRAATRAQAGRLIDALVAGVSVDDPEAAQQVLSSMALVSGAAPELLSDAAKEQLAAVVTVGGWQGCWGSGCALRLPPRAAADPP